MTEVPVIVGAGPAGMRAALTLAAAGRRPVVIDEAPTSGGQVFRRPPPERQRAPRALYGFDADHARALHHAFDAARPEIDYRPNATVWSADASDLHLVESGRRTVLRWSRLILATGAMDRVIPIPGWTAPGAYTLGGAQIALKAQALLVGRRIAFFGTGPLLYLVAKQYAKAGADVVAVVDTRPRDSFLRCSMGLIRGGRLLLNGLIYLADLKRRGVRMEIGARPLEILAGDDGAVAGFRFLDHVGNDVRLECDAVAFGYGLRSETQIADLLDLDFSFDDRQRQWLPTQDADTRASRPGVYLAGDGARVRGAAAAAIDGERAALALLHDDGEGGLQSRIDALRARSRSLEPFRRAIDETAFPFPVGLAQEAGDALMICRCEGITAGAIRQAVTQTGEADVNRLKAFTRLGMGRCQGRVCGAAAVEIIAAAAEVPIEATGRLRGQAPIKPTSLAALAERVP